MTAAGWEAGTGFVVTVSWYCVPQRVPQPCGLACKQRRRKWRKCLYYLFVCLQGLSWSVRLSFLSAHTHTHTHTHMNMPSNANLMSQMLRERHEMPQKCHHSTPVTGLIQPLNPPLPCKHIRTYTHLHVCVFVCDGVGGGAGDQLVVFSLWVPVPAWSSRVVPIIPSLLSSWRPKGPA